ncbi:MAG TPA: tetratricopeptide repeat protein [Povalibacter sp.]|jgi:predicted TPR repeat methyltransferase|nr:tetratricopeptide repeat protein [Povalibacter sp.]
MAMHDPVLARAIAAHQSGRLKEAQAGYQRVLRKRPGDADALHFLGMLRFQSGEAEDGLRLVRQSLARVPGNPHAWNNLGNMLSVQDRSAEAREAYERVTRLAPTLAEVWYNLGICCQDEGDFAAAQTHFRTAIQHRPEFLRVYEALGMLLYRLGDFRGAAEIYTAWAQRDPGNPVARHMAAATSGIDVPERADDEYVAGLFDKFAAYFDQNLKKLRYRAPEIVSSALASHCASTDSRLDILDAGCGTGLCGPLLKPMSRSLAGVDLSPKMIEHARNRGGYDELAVGELVQFMRSRPHAFDAIVSADTLVYFGAIAEACAAAFDALRPGGLLIFTVEALPADAAEDFRLEVHGRYAHNEHYVRHCLEVAGFALCELRRESLRMERMQEVIGFLVLAQRPA